MAITAATLMVKVGADVSEASLKLARFGQDITGIGDKIAGAGKSMMVGITLPLVAAGGAAMKFAMDAEEAANKVDVVFGGAASSVHAFAAGAVANLQMTSGQAEETMGTLGALLTASGIGQGEAAQMVQDLAQRAADLGSIMNMTTDVVMGKIRSGLTGEMEPLKDLGIILSASRVEAHALAMGLGHTTVSLSKVNTASIAVEKALANYNKAVEKHGEGSLEARDAAAKLESAQDRLNKAMAGGKTELTEAEKAQARYSLIMKDSAWAQGDLANTAESSANQMKFLAVEVRQLAEDFGKLLIPVVLPLVSGLRQLVMRFMALPEPIKKTILTIAMIAAAVGPVLMVIGKLIALGGTLVTAWGVITGLFGGVAAAIGAAAAPILVVIGLIAAAVLALKVAWERNFLGIRDILTTAWEAIKQIFEHIKGIVQTAMSFIRGEISLEEAIGKIQEHLGAIGEIISTAWENIKLIFQEHMEALREAAGRAWELIKTLVGDALQGIWDKIIEVLESVKTAWSEAWEGLKQKALDLATSIKDGVLEILGGLVDGVYEKGKALAERFGQGIRDALQRALDFARDMVNRIRALLPGSDAKVGPLSDLYASGKALPITFAKGIKHMSGQAVSAAEDMAGVFAKPMMFDQWKGQPPGVPLPGGMGTTVNITIHNPTGRPTEESIIHALKQLAAVGLLNPVGA